MEKMELVQNDSPERMTYKDSTYEIVSKVAYLIGVRNLQMIVSEDGEVSLSLKVK